jgi:allantoicase
MVYTGAWYDGWETRRHNQNPFDWVVVRLGAASGRVVGVEVDTAFFSGNHAPAISVEGCVSEDDAEVVGWAGARGRWEPVLDIRECGPSRRFAWRLAAPTAAAYTHVRLNMYPDGGIARFRLYGHAVPVLPAAQDAGALVDLASAQNGGVAVACSDQHFGAKDNLLLPGRGKDMGDGWETARSRARGHVDWAIVKLGFRGTVASIGVDTAHFRGNFPQKVRVEAIDWQQQGAEQQPAHDDPAWRTLVADSPCKPDFEHEFAPESGEADKPATHVKLVMVPDGGVKRLRVWGHRAV